MQRDIRDSSMHSAGCKMQAETAYTEWPKQVAGTVYRKDNIIEYSQSIWIVHGSGFNNRL